MKTIAATIHAWTTPVMRPVLSTRATRALAAGLLMAAHLLTVPAQAEARVDEVLTASGIRAYLVSEPAVPLLAVTFHWRGGARRSVAARACPRWRAARRVPRAGQLAFRTILETSDPPQLQPRARRLHGSSYVTENREEAFDLLRSALAERASTRSRRAHRQQLQADIQRRRSIRTMAALPGSGCLRGHPFGGHPAARFDPGDRVDELALMSGQARARKLIIACRESRGGAGTPARDAFGHLPETASCRARAGGTAHRETWSPGHVAERRHSVSRASPATIRLLRRLCPNTLGGGGFARAHEEVREKRGLAYSVFLHSDADWHLCGAGRTPTTRWPVDRVIRSSPGLPKAISDEETSPTQTIHRLLSLPSQQRERGQDAGRHAWPISDRLSRSPHSYRAVTLRI
jgi:zinc protease